MPEKNLDTLLDDKEVARQLGIRAETLAVWRCTGRYKLPFLKIGRCVRYRQQDVIAWIAARSHDNGSTGGAK